MSLKSFLVEKRAALYERWLERALASYPADASTFLRRERDRFANPVGQTLAEELSHLLDLILDEVDRRDRAATPGEAFASPLRRIIKIRAIQDMRSSTALGFLFELKGVIREMLRDRSVSADDESAELADRTALEDRIDQLGLLAFDLWTENQGLIAQIKIDEVKRSVSGLVRRLNREAEAAGAESPYPEESPS